MRRTYIHFALKLLVSAVLLYILFNAIDVRALFALSLNIPFFLFLLAVLSYFSATLIATWRWGILLRSRGITIEFLKLLAYNISFMFYSLALPGGKVAAEGVRLFQIVSDASDPTLRMNLIPPSLIDRLLSVLVSLAISMVYFFFVASSEEFPPWLPYAGITTIVLAVVSVVFPYERFFGVTMEKKDSLAHSAFSALRSFRSHPRELFEAGALSVLVNAACALGMYFMALGVGLSVSYPLLFLIFSVGMTSSVLPITLGGIGVREGVVAYLLSISAGASLELGAAVSLTALAASMMQIFVAIPIEIKRNFFSRAA